MESLVKMYSVLEGVLNTDYAPNSPILRCHYEFTPHFFIFMFFTVLGHWPEDDDINCVSKYDKAEPDDIYYDFCLYYGYATLDGVKGYPLFYRYTHWIFLLMAALYGLILRLAIYFKGRPRLSAVLTRLDDISIAEDSEDVEVLSLNQDANRAVFSYFKDYFEGDAKDYFCSFVFLHLFAMVLNAFAFFIIDLLFQKRYHALFLLIPYVRDYWKFQDPISFAFPHFIDCDITREMHVLVNREEHFGCHLPYMIWFEKYLVVAYSLQLALGAFNLVYLVYKIIFLLFTRFSSMRCVSNEPRLSLSRVMILKEFKKRIPHRRFLELLDSLTD